MTKLYLIRHGQSEYNLKNLFTGWLDVSLTDQGREEAKKAAQLLKDIGAAPKVIFTSNLKRAHQTLAIIVENLNLKSCPVHANQALNERHYGDLQGKNKAETAKQFGEEQVKIWRRSFDIAPPNGESLKDTAARTIPYFKKEILPFMIKGQDVLIVAHGNSLRSIIMEIEKMTPDQILKTELATGEAWEYEFSSETFKRMRPVK